MYSGCLDTKQPDFLSSTHRFYRYVLFLCSSIQLPDGLRIYDVLKNLTLLIVEEFRAVSLGRPELFYNYSYFSVVYPLLSRAR